MLIVPASAVSGMDFAPVDDSNSSIADDYTDDMNRDPEPPYLEPEQGESRVTRPQAFGIGFGEDSPHISASLHYRKILDDVSAYGIVLGRGDYRTTEQNEGEAWSENVGNVVMVGAEYLWWPSRHFPFAISLGVNAEVARGTVTSKTGSRGEYQARTLYAASGLTMDYIFDSGFWIDWTLIAINYGKNIGGTYSNLSGKQMVNIRDNFEHLKITGVANLTLGYAWQ